MRHRTGLLLVFLLGAAMLVGFCAAATAKGQKKDDRRDRERQNLEQKIQKNQRRLDDLQRDQSRLNKEIAHLEKSLPSTRENLKKSEAELHSNEPQIKKVREAFDAAQLKLKKAKEQLAEIARHVEESQPSTSPFGQSKAAYLGAKDAYGQAVDRVENSPDYKAAYQQAVASDSRATLLPQVRKKWIDDNPDVARARSNLREAKAVYERLLSQLLHQSPEWVQASDALEQAEKRETEQEKELRSLSGKVATLKKSVDRLQAEVKKADDSLRQDRSELRKLPEKINSLRREIDDDQRARKRLR